ncbi:MAG: zinc ribbon domain-containing protein [Solobacterium sp.]|nr:zinc ribbon domain-containing protein [Solobacterium sp.]
MNCIHCGKPVSDTAVVCPYCGKPPQDKMPVLAWAWYRYIGIIGAVLIALVTMFMSSSMRAGMRPDSLQMFAVLLGALIAIAAMCFRKAEALYPAGVILIGFGYQNYLKSVWKILRPVLFSRGVISSAARKAVWRVIRGGFPGVFTAGWFMIVGVGFFIVLKYTIGQLYRH